jgi:hypothetical protein
MQTLCKISVVGAVVLLVAIGHVWAANDEVEKIHVAPGRATATVNLRDRLVVGLQARLKSEVAFVGRTNFTYRPIVFFEPAMRARAKRLKVDL